MRRAGLLVFAGLLFVAALARDGFDLWVESTIMPSFAVATGTEVRARDGTLLRAFAVADGRWRLDTTVDDADPAFIAMLIAYEDKRFWRHHGVDPLAILRAAAQAALSGHVVSGASTLTMQTARLLDGGGTGRWGGKLRQIRLALALERRLTKSEILDLYLNLAPYGGNIEGLRAASFAWLGKEPRRLTPAEAALMIALPQAPEARRPDRDPAAARGARDRVLVRLAAAGAIPGEEAGAAMRDPVPAARRPFPALAPHLADRLRRATPFSARIDTTLDADLQRRIEALAKRAASAGGARGSVAILLADHATGEILASVGAPDWQDEGRAGYVDMTQAIRSPGSLLKPFVYALAFDEGLAHPETLIEDTPARFGNYAPQNFDRHFRGTIRVREALIQSLNIPAVRLTEAIGPERLVATLRRAGATVNLPPQGAPGLAVALGGAGMSLEGLVTAYGGLARLGAPLQLSALRGMPGAGRLFSETAAWQVAEILQGMPPPAGAPKGLAYKTGTSYGHRDAWAIGFDGRHVIGVWIGRPDGTPVPGAFGGDRAAPILFEAFGRLKPRLDPLPPPPAATLMVTNAELPPPLRRFRPRNAVFAPSPDAPDLAFPPEGAEIEAAGAVIAKVRNGIPPFTWLANGVPVATGLREREALLSLGGPGFVTLSVIDAGGRADSTAIRLR